MRHYFLPALLLGSAVFAQDPSVENPTSNNRSIPAIPAPGPVVIDGKSDDWDLSGGIWSYNDPTLVDKYSVWSHVMYDDKGVYLLMRYRDDSPMKNDTRGRDFHQSWQADAFQGRVVFDENTPEEHQMHINGFYSSEENRPYMIVHHGGFRKEKPFDGTGPFRQDQLDKYSDTMEAFGGKIAFREWEDGKGYNMEIFWPWKYVRTNGLPLKAGDSFNLGLEAMWGNHDGTKLEHRLVDNMKDDAVNRIFFFRAKNGWGKVVLANKGNLSTTEEQKTLQAGRLKKFLNYETAGSMPIEYTLPEDREVTIAIDNAEGARVRNLFGQFPRSAGKNIDYWDGLDDSGNPLPAGKYTATIIDHLPIKVKFLNSVYNSSTPPWVTEQGNKTWGSNHGHPTTAATLGDINVIGFTGTEGAPGVIRVDKDGRILWSEVTEVVDLTMDDKFVYLLSRESWTKRTMVRKLDINNGDIVLFDNPERSTESVLPVDVKEVTDAASIAAAYGKLFALVPGKGLWKLNPPDGKIEETLDIAGIVALENHDGKLWGLFADGRIAQIDASGKVASTAITAQGVKEPTRFAISQDGQRYAVSDRATNQVFVYDSKGKRINTLGEAYADQNEMRPAGKFIETNLVDPNGLAFDAQGRLWVAEANHSCRRVTLWDAQGKLEDQFWGSADYGAMFGFAFVNDSTRFMVHGIEFKLDPNPDVMNRPTKEKAIAFHPELAHGKRGLVYSYKGHEYAMTSPQTKQPGFTIAKRGNDGVFHTVVKIDYDDPRSKNTDESKAWIDRNENGREDEGETTAPIKGAHHYWSAGWVTPELNILTANQFIYRPTGFTDGGVPLYDFSSPERPAKIITGLSKGDNIQPAPTGAVGTFVMDRAGNISDGMNFATADGRTGAYPNPYKRHDAPAARRGLLIAPFRTNGVVEDVPQVGSITALGGDRGQWFLMTLDGLYLSAILQDSKGEVTLDDTFVGQESFGGFIWRDEKGRVLVQLGGPSFRIEEVTGLDSVRKQKIELRATDATIAEGMKIAAANRKAAYQEPETLGIAKVGQLPNNPPDPGAGIDKTLIDGAETARIQEDGDPARWFRVALAHDGKSLAIAYQVNDSSPWKNGEGRFSHAFIGGDCVDLKLDIPGRGPIRILGAPLVSGNTVTYWQKKADMPRNSTTYVVSNNEANAQQFDVVTRLDGAKIKVAQETGRYSVLITIPLDAIGLDPSKIKEIKGIAGVIFSDPAGTNRAARLYWHDKGTGMVSDVPTEARLDPQAWGSVKIGQ